MADATRSSAPKAPSSKPSVPEKPEPGTMRWSETRTALGVDDHELRDMIAHGLLRAFVPGGSGNGYMRPLDECRRIVTFREKDVRPLAKLLEPGIAAACMCTSSGSRVSAVQLFLWSQERTRKALRRYLETLAGETPGEVNDVREALEMLDSELAPEVPAAPLVVPALVPARLSIGAKVEMAVQLIASWSGPDRDDVEYVAKKAIDQVDAIELQYVGRAAADDTGAAERALRDAEAAESPPDNRTRSTGDASAE